jgi:hypothetical protein
MFWTVVREKEAVKRGKLPIQSQKSMGAEAFAKFHAAKAKQKRGGVCRVEKSHCASKKTVN